MSLHGCSGISRVTSNGFARSQFREGLQLENLNAFSALVLVGKWDGHDVPGLDMRMKML